MLGVEVGVLVGDAVALGVGVSVGLGVVLGVTVGLGETVGVPVAETVGVAVAVGVAVGVAVAVGVGVGVVCAHPTRSASTLDSEPSRDRPLPGHGVYLRMDFWANNQSGGSTRSLARRASASARKRPT